MTRIKYCISAVLYTLASLSIILAQSDTNIESNEAEWTSLIKETDLDNWEQKGGKAEYRLEDGSIIGKTVANTPNSFLCTREHFGNFILEYEVRFKDPNQLFNSGVQVRSNSLPEYLDGRVHGYQVEIDPSERAWSAGIYDEGRRGWLYNLLHDEQAREAIDLTKWNHFRVEAIDNTIRTWLNGIPCANLIDDMTAEGFIGLQVHSVYKPEDVGKEIIWRNIRIITKQAELYTTETTAREITAIPNSLSKDDIAEGWQLLFDGSTTEGWRKAHESTFPESGWHVKDGALILEDSEDLEGGDIVTVEEFENFDLLIDFKISDGANSGIKYLVTEDYNFEAYTVGLEYQILDDKANPDAMNGNKRTLASLYDLIPAKEGKSYYHGYWNIARIIVQGNHIEHWLNREKVLEYDRNDASFDELVAKSKFKDIPAFGKWEKGHIMLQDHGHNVQFRNIKIRKLQ